MVAVRDINALHLGKAVLHQLTFIAVFDDPDTVAYIAVRHKVVDGLFFHIAFHDLIDQIIAAVGEKNGTGLCIAGIDMADAVLLLVFPRIFMLFDYAVLIVVDRGDSHNAGLCAAVPCL
jgi:hypothetical protein